MADKGRIDSIARGTIVDWLENQLEENAAVLAAPRPANESEGDQLSRELFEAESAFEKAIIETLLFELGVVPGKGSP